MSDQPAGTKPDTSAPAGPLPDGVGAPTRVWEYLSRIFVIDLRMLVGGVVALIIAIANG